MDLKSESEDYDPGLFAVFEHLPVPMVLALDGACARVRANRAFRELCGTEEEFTLSALAVIGRDVQAENPLATAAREGVTVLGSSIAVRHPAGHAVELLVSAWPVGHPDRLTPAALAVAVPLAHPAAADVRSALEDSERRYRLITEAMPQFVWLDAPDGSAVYANARWLEYTGLTEAENRGFGWHRVVHPDDARRLAPDRESTLHSGADFEGECRYRGRDGKYRWFLFRSIPVRDPSGTITGWLGTATDIDKQKRAEEQQAFFALAGETLASTLDVGVTLERIARLGTATLGTWCQIDLPDRDGLLRPAVVAHRDRSKEAILAPLLDRVIYRQSAAHGPPAAFATGDAQLVERVREHVVEDVIPNAGYREAYRQAGYYSGIVVPLQLHDTVLGTLMIASDDPARLYTEFDVSTARELGRRGAIALENARSFAREHRVATTLQRALLPAALPKSDLVSFDAAYAAAASAQGEAVGGDWYDAFVLPDGRIAVGMGDVAGHGIGAAVTMSVVRQAMRAAALEDPDPGAILARTQKVLDLEARTAMITALFGVLDPAARTFTYALAGHPRPLMTRDDGTLLELEGGGVPLGGAFSPAWIEVRSIQTDPPATIVFYTDGLLEYNRDALRGEQRIAQAVSDRFFLYDDRPAQALIDTVLDAPQRDDIAVLVLRIDDPRAEALRVTMPAKPRSAPILRDCLREFLKSLDADDDLLFRMSNGAGEAVANAIEHAYAGDTGPVELRVERVPAVVSRHMGSRFIVEVADRGAWKEAPPANPQRGRGLGIMRALSRGFQVDRGSLGTTVHMEF